MRSGQSQVVGMLVLMSCATARAHEHRTEVPKAKLSERRAGCARRVARGAVAASMMSLRVDEGGVRNVAELSPEKKPVECNGCWGYWIRRTGAGGRNGRSSSVVCGSWRVTLRRRVSLGPAEPTSALKKDRPRSL